MNITQKLDNYIGFQFNDWKIVERDLTKTRPAKYYCQCKCGKISSIHLSNLKAEYSKRCANCQALARSQKMQEMIGKKFNCLQIINIDKINGIAKAKARCDCGNEIYKILSYIKNGTYKSCGKCGITNINKKKYMILGEKYGMLTVVKILSKEKCLAKCDCGNLIEIFKYQLKTTMPCCGCYRKNQHIANAKKLIGTEFGYLKVVKSLIFMESNLVGVFKKKGF